MKRRLTAIPKYKIKDMARVRSLRGGQDHALRSIHLTSTPKNKDHQLADSFSLILESSASWKEFFKEDSSTGDPPPTTQDKRMLVVGHM